MVLSKGKKIILIAIVLIIISVAGFLFYRSYQGSQTDANRVINEMFDYLDSTNDFDYDDESTYPEFIEEFNEVSGKSQFQKELVRIVDEFAEVGIHNYDVGLDDMMETRYGDRLYYGEIGNLFCNVVSLLNRIGYEDEKLRDSFTSFFVNSAQGARDRTYKDATTQEIELEQGNYLDQVLQDAADFSQAGGDFYQIPTDQIATVDEISQHYSKAIQLSYDADDKATFAKALSSATSSSFLAGQVFWDSQEIVDFLMEDGGELYTLLSGVGGYYDTHLINEVGQITYYGDFGMRVTTSGGDEYDTSGLDDGVWDSLTPGQRDEIISGNQAHINNYYYLLGEVYNGNLNPALGDEGYGYVYLNKDGSAVCFQNNSIVYVHQDNSLDSIIYGNFSGVYEKAEKEYQASLLSFDTEAVILAEEPYTSYTGNFKEKTGRWNFTIYSEFWMYNDEVYWLPREPINLRADDTLVHSFFAEPVLVENMIVEETYGKITATVTFADGTIHCTIKENDTLLADYDLVKEA